MTQCPKQFISNNIQPKIPKGESVIKSCFVSPLIHYTILGPWLHHIHYAEGGLIKSH